MFFTFCQVLTKITFIPLKKEEEKKLDILEEKKRKYEENMAKKNRYLKKTYCKNVKKNGFIEYKCTSFFNYRMSLINTFYDVF